MHQQRARDLCPIVLPTHSLSHQPHPQIAFTPSIIMWNKPTKLTHVPSIRLQWRLLSLQHTLFLYEDSWEQFLSGLCEQQLEFFPSNWFVFISQTL